MNSQLNDSLDPLQAWHAAAAASLPGLSVLIYDPEFTVLSSQGDPPCAPGLGPDGAIGRALGEVLPTAMWTKLESELRAALDGGTSSFEMPFSDGDCLHWIEIGPLRVGGALVGGVLTSQDVGDRLIAEQELLELTGSFETAFTKAPIGMAMVALDGSLIRANPAFARLTGYELAETTNLRFQDMIPIEDHEHDLMMTTRLMTGEINSYSAEKRIIGKSNREIWALIATSVVHDGEGRPNHLIAQVQDISGRRELELELRRVAGEDALTGLANRRRLETTLEDQIERCRRYDETAALLMIDLDEFKVVNDTHGHSTGDQVLKFVANQLTTRLRSTDLVARPGGDEFAAVVVGTDDSRATNLVAELTEHFDTHLFEPQGRALSCRASIGATIIDSWTGSMDEVLARADHSMYRAKSARKSRP